MKTLTPAQHPQSRKVTLFKEDEVVTNLGQHAKRVLIGTPTLGSVRVEWHNARKSQIIPINFTLGETYYPYSAHSVFAVGYQVADAQNVCVQNTLENNYEFLLLHEDDVLPPHDGLMKINHWMELGETPIVSGLYFTKGMPSWPLVFRGRGNGAYLDWTMGETVWCDGAPTGFIAIHRSILSYMWDHSEKYTLPDGKACRKVFEFPQKSWYDPEKNNYFAKMGTSDLYFCDRVRTEEVYKKTGWTKLAGKRYPFPIDTSIFCGHISPQGQIYPDQGGVVLWPQKKNGNGKGTA